MEDFSEQMVRVLGRRKKCGCCPSGSDLAAIQKYWNILLSPPLPICRAHKFLSILPVVRAEFLMAIYVKQLELCLDGLGINSPLRREFPGAKDEIKYCVPSQNC